MSFRKRPMRSKKRSKTRTKAKKKDPIFVDGERPRPMYVDYKDVELLKKLINRHGRIVVRRKTGCTAVSQRAVTKAVKRARFMGLLPYVGD
ncbi:MAG: 30S ribosomal protein S18 [Pirellulaceae bacterium]|nr:30S ribosomal protein S18 [Planctomycetales bacterium]